MLRKKIAKITKPLIISTFTILLLALIYFNFTHHIHTVIPNQIYRSAQLSAPGFIRAKKEEHIRTILNLRGKNPSFASYQMEIALSKKLKLNHYDIRLWSRQLPSVKQLHRLIYLLEHAPKPILVHCKSGADRSGLASAIALELEDVRPLPLIERQFSLAYFVTSSDSIGKLVFRHYKNWLEKNHYKNSRKHFLEWAYSKKPFDTY